MVDNAEEVLVGDNSEGRGSRKRQKVENKVRLGQNERYAPKDIELLNFNGRCRQPLQIIIKKMECIDITKDILIAQKKKIFIDNIKMAQNERLSKLLMIKYPSRRRPKELSQVRKPHALHLTYMIRHDIKEYVVCQKFFEELFEVSKRRILWIAKNIQNGRDFRERRGGKRSNCDKKMEKREKVISFIGKFKAQESYYSRNKSRRLYLPAALNIRKMYKMYNSAQPQKYQISYSYFHKIFSCHFNLGFGTPATDVCSYCERTKNKIKFASNQEIKVTATRYLHVHKFRAKQFNLIMKETPANTVSFCFDLQQVQNLPKLPIQEAFYSLKIAFYAFCIVDVHAKTPIFYTWNEVQSRRGSNEVGSALLHFLRNYNFEANITKIRLFSDGCGGQNKNSHIIHMLMFWLLKYSPETIHEIEFIFPVRGHSYLPADRVFGRLEKELRRHDRIVFPEEYVQLYSRFGAVRKMGEDWHVYNLKSLIEVFKKMEGISEQKRVYIKKNTQQGRKNILVNSEINFRVNDPSKKYVTLLKRGKLLNNVNLQNDTEEHGISQDKGRAVNALLKQAFGDQWYLEDSFGWYFEVLRDFIIDHANDELNYECECHEEEVEPKH